MSEDIILPLTLAQRELWIGHKISPPGAIGNLAEAIELHGAVDERLLLQAIGQTAQEMQATRIRIDEHRGMPRQVVMPHYSGPVRRLDFSARADPRADAMDWMMAELATPVDFATGQTFRTAVLKLADTGWFLYFCAHHVVMDGYTAALGVRRVAELYTALRSGRAAPPATFHPLSVLLQWEAAYRASSRFVEDRAYWRQQMADPPEPVTLSRRDAPARGGLLRSTAMISRDQARRLQDRVKGMNVSLPQTLIALVAAYYFRISGAADLVFGMPVTARVNGTLRRCPGMVANIIPIRLKMSLNQSFDALFHHVASTVREALRHQQYRYLDFALDAGWSRHHRRIPRLCINIEPFDYQLTFDGVAATPRNLANGHVQDLTVFIYDHAGLDGLRIDLDANPGLYQQAELDTHKQRLCRLIEAVARQPGKTLGQVGIIEPDQLEKISRLSNTAADNVPLATVPETFTRQAARTPDALAVLPDDRSKPLTYRELDEQSRLLAQRLVVAGVARGDTVLAILPRSSVLLVALLGILRSGAIYLPIDPDEPASRLLLMTVRAGAVCVVTHSDCRPAALPAGLPVLQIDEPATDLAAFPALPQPLGVSYAYATFISGSSGHPEKVQVTHAALANLLEGMRQILGSDCSDRLLSVSAVNLDVAVFELLLPVVAGGSVVIAGDAVIADPRALARFIATSGPTILHASAAQWHRLLAEPVKLSAIQALVAGDTLSSELASRLLCRARRVISVFGSAETAIFSTAMVLSAEDVDVPPIGRPIRNTRAYVLDADGHNVPIGVPGRLHIGGAASARVDPVAQSTEPGPCATGDVVRWREDGVLQYLGRVDNRLNIDGWRIEPLEIELLLCKHADVARAAVVRRVDPNGEFALVAYLTSPGGEPPAGDIMRQHLAGLLPQPMIPRLFVWLDKLPLTQAGALDRVSLPPPPWRCRAVKTPTPPRTRTERRLVEIWQNILRQRDIGVDDNFFELGGDSFNRAELFVALTDAFDARLGFESLFGNLTITGLATMLDGGEAVDSLGVVLPLKTEGSLPPLFCIHPVFGLGLSYATLIQHLDVDQPIYAFQSPGLRGDETTPSDRPGSIEELGAVYLAELRRIQSTGPYHLLGWSMGGLIAHEMARQLRRDGAEVAFLGLLDSFPFHTQAGAWPGLTELADYISGTYDLYVQPTVRAIFAAEPAIRQHLAQVVLRNLELAARYRPGMVDIDVVICVAARRFASGLETWLQLTPDAWRGCVRHLTVYDVGCRHEDMLSAPASARIGSILREHLYGGSGDLPA